MFSKKNVWFTCIVSFLLFVFLVLAVRMALSEEETYYARDYEDLQISIDYSYKDEVFQDADTPERSTYLYKNADSVDPLIHAGPVWDYDRAWGVLQKPVLYRRSHVLWLSGSLRGRTVTA